MFISGEEVPSYFTHRTTGTSLTIPLTQTFPSQSFFTFKVCAVVIIDSVPKLLLHMGYIHVNCRFKDRFGNSFDSFREQYCIGWCDEKETVLFILDIRIPINKDNAPLAELNYDHVDIQLHQSYTTGGDPRFWSNDKLKLKGWGIRLCEDFSSPESRLENPNTPPRVCEVDEKHKANETESGEERRDSLVEIERSHKRIRIT